MAIQINNQKPAILYNDPFNVLFDITPDKDETEYIKRLDKHLEEKYIDPLFVPINPQNPVVIEDIVNNTSTPIDKQTIFESIQYLWTNPTIDVDLENQINDIYRQGVQYLTPNDWYFEEQLGIEALTKMKLPPPSNQSGKIIKYTANTDLIPSAKQLLAQNDDTNATDWFARITGYTHTRPFNNYLLMTVETSDAFEKIKTQIKSFMQVWQTTSSINTNVVNLLNDFDKIDLSKDLSAGLFLPNNGGASSVEHQPFSFTRILMYVLNQFEKSNQGELLIQPTNLNQLYMPENIIIMNLENYAHALASEIKADWDDFEKAINSKKALNFITNKKLMTTKSMNKSLNLGQKSSSQKSPEVGRRKLAKFSGKPIPAQNMLALMKQVIESQITRQKTENTYKSYKFSYMRSNRREPENINLPGKLTTIQYRPDIHVYLDTSGSIDEKQYRDAISNLILLTKKIDCNLYFTSFSSYVSQTALLKTKDKSINQIYQEFLKVPKVEGGTDFNQVWRKIDMLGDFNKKQGLSHQINFIITDFGYSLSRGHKWDKEQPSLKNTYYVPISADQRTWQTIIRWGNKFMQQMSKAGDYGIRNRILM